MKSPFHFSLPLTALNVAVLALALAGCGQKGPLYLGKPPPPHPVRNAEPTDMPASDAGSADTADTANVTTNAVDMTGAPEMSIMPESGANTGSGASTNAAQSTSTNKAAKDAGTSGSK